MRRLLAPLLLLTAVPAGLAVPVTFSVGGFPPEGQSLAVLVGNTPTKLTLGQDGVLWSGTAEAQDNQNYKYAVVDATGAAVTTEPFDRTVPQGTDKTLNDFWMRPMTTKDHPRLTQVWPAWPRGYSRLFDETYIPTIHITGDDTAILQILGSKTGVTQVDVIWVGKSETAAMTNLTFKAGGQSSKDFDKTQINLKMPEGASVEGRSEFKLRAGRTDPSFLRERLYTDILNAIGVPVAQGCHARVYINKKFRGLYYFEDDIAAGWGNVVIRPSPDAAVSLAEVSSGGDGNFVFNSYGAYTFILNATEPPINDMMPAMKALADFPAATATAEQVSALKQSIDYNMVYKTGSVEYLAAHWDCAWESASNYFLASINKVWFPMSSDFDQTLGLFLDLTNGSLNATLEGWAYASQRIGTGERPLFDKPLENPQMRGEFVDVLKTIVQGVFHEQGVRSRLQSLHDFLRADFADDANTAINPIISTGKNFNWTVEHFDASWDQGANAANLSCDGWDCKYGLVSYITEKSAAVAAIYGFTFENTYVPPKDGEWYGGQKLVQGGVGSTGGAGPMGGTGPLGGVTSNAPSAPDAAALMGRLLPVAAIVTVRFAVF